MQREVHLYSISGACLGSVALEEGWLLSNLHAAVDEAIGIPVDAQRLLLDATILGPPSLPLDEVLPADQEVDLTLVRSEDPFVVFPSAWILGETYTVEIDHQPSTVENMKHLFGTLDDCKGFWQGPACKNAEYLCVKRHGFQISPCLQTGMVLAQNFHLYLEGDEDRDLVLGCVRRSHDVLTYVKDRRIIEAAIVENPASLIHVNQRMLGDLEFMLGVVAVRGAGLASATPKLRANKVLVMAAVSQDGHALRFASEALRADPEVVRAALETQGSALRYASDELRGDKDLALIAVSKNGYTFRYLSQALQADRDVVLAAVRERGEMLEYACAELRRDVAVLEAAVLQNPDAKAFTIQGRRR